VHWLQQHGVHCSIQGAPRVREQHNLATFHNRSKHQFPMIELLMLIGVKHADRAEQAPTLLHPLL
jgi:hypothetical protein